MSQTVSSQGNFAGSQVLGNSHSKLVEAEVIDPAEKPPEQLDAILQDIYRVHQKIFTGVTVAEFTETVVKPSAVRTRIQLYRSETGVLVGYCAIHILEVRSKWRCCAVLRAEAGLLPGFRGSARTLWFGAKEAFRYKFLHPFRPVVFFAMIVHPSSYHLISKYFWKCYPSAFHHIPNRWRRILLELAENSGDKVVDPTDPLIRYADWITRDSEKEAQIWQECLFEDVQYFLFRNPGYSQGHGLAVIAPLSISNLLVSFVQYLISTNRFHQWHRTNGTQPAQGD